MNKKTKILLGSVVDIVFGFIAVLWWMFTMEGVKIRPRSMKDWVLPILIVVIIPTVLMFVLWFIRCFNRLNTGDQKEEPWVLFWVIGAVVCVAVAILPCLLVVNLNPVLKYAACAAVLGAAGSLVPYFVFKP